MKRACILGSALVAATAAWGCDDGSTFQPPGSPDGGAAAAADGAPPAVDGAEPAQCSGLAAQPTDAEWTVESSGRTRRFRVHVPASYDPGVPAPLVLNFHGLTHDPDKQIALSRMNELADDAGFIAVHPQGVGNSWNAGGCCGTASADDIDDVGFVSDLLDAVSSELCIDPARVYATGMSNGGHMSYRLGCDLADRIAAIAPVAGVNVTGTCEPTRPVPVIHFHGTSDLIVPYDDSPLSSLPPVDETIDAWASRNGCGTTRTEVFANGDSVCEQLDGCPAGAAVVLCTVDGGGHTWPGGDPSYGIGKTTDDLSATAAMWEFWNRP